MFYPQLTRTLIPTVLLPANILARFRLRLRTRIHLQRSGRLEKRSDPLGDHVLFCEVATRRPTEYAWSHVASVPQHDAERRGSLLNEQRCRQERKREHPTPSAPGEPLPTSSCVRWLYAPHAIRVLPETKSAPAAGTLAARFAVGVGLSPDQPNQHMDQPAPHG